MVLFCLGPSSPIKWQSGGHDDAAWTLVPVPLYRSHVRDLNGASGGTAAAWRAIPVPRPTPSITGVYVLLNGRCGFIDNVIIL